MKYPEAPRVELVEILHGVPVADPFRPLEHAADPATIAWVAAENALTRQSLDGALRDRLVEQLRQLHRYPRSSVPANRGPRLFFTHNDGSANQATLVVREEGIPWTTRILVDPNLLDPGGTTAITTFEPDDSGRLVVYALSRNGSDVQELRVVDAETGVGRPDLIRWVKFASIAWLDDGFFYTRFPEPGTVPPGEEQYGCQVWFHALGEAQAADRLVFQRPDAPTIVFDVDVTSDGALLVVTSHPGASDKAEIHVLPLPAPRTFEVPARPLVTGFTDGWHFVGGDADRLVFRTDAGAPRGRIVRFELRDSPAMAHDVLAESADTIVDATIADGGVLVHSLHNGSSRLQRLGLDGRNDGAITLPGIGTIVGMSGRWQDGQAYATFTSFTMPPTILTLFTTKDTKEGSSRDVEPSSKGLSSVSSVSFVVKSSDYSIEQVWYPSKDGTPISMFLVRKRVQAEAGQPAPAPVLLTGYGGFNISLTPAFDPSDFLWLERGGVMAVAQLRGGGEYGEAWHRAGMRDRKQNVFDDFIAAAEWLLATGVAEPGRIAIEGGSNGGLLVGAVMVQRPDLVGAVVCRVPVADMLRYHLFTVGRFWIPEYGSADDPAEFACLLRYSPYHNVRDGVAYPPTLVMTADTDDRVDPGMAKKFAARLQEAVRGHDGTTSGGPILLRVETRAGHGAGKPIGKQIDEQADLYAFLLQYPTR